MILASLQRGLAAGILSAACVVGFGAGAMAQPANKTTQAKPTPAKPAAKPAAAPAAKAAPASKAKPAAAAAAGGAALAGPGGSSLLASSGDWRVYVAQTGRSKLCYALSQPKERLPAGLNRDPAYVFVSFNPAENVRNEVAFVMGFATKETAPATATIGSTSYALLARASNAWLKNPAEEAQAIGTMAKGSSLIVKSQSIRGSQLTDRYSLSGFNQALDRARKECQ